MWEFTEKSIFLGWGGVGWGESWKTKILEVNFPKKGGGLGQFADLKGGLANKRVRVVKEPF